MKLILTFSLLLSTLLGPSISLAQNTIPLLAKNDFVSIVNKTIIDQVNYIDINFLGNDKYSPLTLDFAQTKLLSQNKQLGMAYLVENNSLMVFYPYEDSFGTDTIVYEICDKKNRCSQACILVDVKKSNQINLQIPSAFSPNGDHIDDQLLIKGIENYPLNEFFVFSARGTKVYEKSNYSNTEAWDGRYNKKGIKLGPGDKLPSGTYYFKLHIKAKKHIKSGNIVIKK